MVIAMVAMLSSSVKSARFNQYKGSVISAYQTVSEGQADLRSLSKIQLRDQPARVQSRLEKAKEEIDDFHAQAPLTDKRHSDEQFQRLPEPARQPSTYIIPSQRYTRHPVKTTRSVPFYLFMAFLGMGLVASIGLVMPVTAVQIGLLHWLMFGLKGLFLAISVSTAVALLTEVLTHHAH